MGAELQYPIVATTQCKSYFRLHVLPYIVLKRETDKSSFCPNREDGTINVLENGVSPQGKFYFQVFKFVGDHNYVYLHCQVHLCRGSCVSPCGARAAADVDVHGSVSIGPFRLADEKDGAGKPSAFGVFSMLGLLLMNKILL
ncbi:uromodulin-like [Engystomops pustulosus]|uniref:uromodulin-like n=1 Tax=Engystomops pustulosus TaxID=76066 RepID=UPI003AFAC2B0